MNKAELINTVSARGRESKRSVENVLETLVDVIWIVFSEGGEVTLPGLGKLTVKDKPARKGRNPKTGEEIDIPAKRVPHFSAAKALKDAVNS